MVGLPVADMMLGTLVANLSYDKLVMPHPVFIGDTMRAETEVTELRPANCGWTGASSRSPIA